MQIVLSLQRHVHAQLGWSSARYGFSPTRTEDGIRVGLTFFLRNST